MDKKITINPAPRGLAVLAVIGPAFVWCAEYIGSGEIILSTRMGAILGYSVLWAPVIGIILKTFIGAGGAHYTVCTGEGMIDMLKSETSSLSAINSETITKTAQRVKDNVITSFDLLTDKYLFNDRSFLQLFLYSE